MEGQQVPAWGPDPDNKGKDLCLFTSILILLKTSIQPERLLQIPSRSLQGMRKFRLISLIPILAAKGIVSNNKLSRHNFNLRLSSQITSKLSFDGKVTYLSENIENRQQTGEAFANSATPHI
jgi:hypothetical protein